MLAAFDFIREFSLLAIVCRLTLAVICGGAIGLEREYKRRAAGFRTHILICLGAAITTLTSQYLYLEAGYFTDLARLGAQVVAGIGFIGAGAIIVTRQRRVKGLTTAAGLWASAIIGLACGAGFAECALLATVCILLAELLLIKLEKAVTGGVKDLNIYVEYERPDAMQSIITLLRKNQINVTDLEISRTKDENMRYCAIISVRPAKGSPKNSIADMIAESGAVLTAEEL